MKLWVSINGVLPFLVFAYELNVRRHFEFEFMSVVKFLDDQAAKFSG